MNLFSVNRNLLFVKINIKSESYTPDPLAQHVVAVAGRERIDGKNTRVDLTGKTPLVDRVPRCKLVGAGSKPALVPKSPDVGLYHIFCVPQDDLQTFNQ